MPDIEFNLLQRILIFAIPLVFAITIHEVAHGWVANRLGDPTARMMGRLTLNPIKHIDPLGTIIIPVALIVLNAGFVFGWAKPVPVTKENLKRPRRDMALVAAAGPITNVIMALIWAAIAKLGIALIAAKYIAGIPLVAMGRFGIIINLVLAVLNLIPLPPLDGSRIADSFLRGKASHYYNMLEPFGFFCFDWPACLRHFS